MYKRPAALLSIIFAGLFLTACGMFAGTKELGVHLEPPIAGFTVPSEDTVEIFHNQVRFSNPAGAPAAMVTGYQVRVFDGEELITDTTGTDAWAIPVPRGYECIDDDDCTFADNKGRATEQFSDSETIVIITSATPKYMLENDVDSLTAEITFEYNRGGAPLTTVQHVSVEYPVGD